MAEFVDSVTLHLAAGNGGHGCTSIRREKFKPLAGPDGGNGGNGGSVIFRVDPQVTTLLTYHHAPHQRAANGGPGAGDMRHGARGADLELPVPPGTVIKSADGELLADLVVEGDTFVAAQGGRGGLGNAALASARRKAPGFALLGEPGDALDVVLELKSIADVALVGFPSAGKSSLIAALSAARPKIADYPFTTLIPNLGVVEAGEVRYTIADVPGLIPGAAEGRGLGLEFLRHIERCAVIVHVLDCATLEPGRDPISDLDALLTELRLYEEQMDEGLEPLTQRPAVVALNKIDVPEARELAEFVLPELHERGFATYMISAVSHAGLRELSYGLARIVAEARAARPAPEARRVVLTPKAIDDTGFTITPTRHEGSEVFQVRGAKPERWVKQTDFTNDEAVGYLADRLGRLGVEEELFKAGARPGATVVIGPLEGGVVFDWEPSLMTGPELLGGPRGTDMRLEERRRSTHSERRERYLDRMDAKTAARDELWTERAAGRWTDPSKEE